MARETRIDQQRRRRAMSTQGRDVLIATLGSVPSTVTLTADLLETEADIAVDEVYVIDTAARGPIGHALESLRSEFHSDRYRDRLCTLREVPILPSDGQPVFDIRTEEDAASAFTAIYSTVLEQREAGNRVHLSISGGRKSQVIYGAVTAQILFDSDDQMWHVLSTPEFQRTG
jgi:CRISPR-associated protein (TIGR02584 family)